VNLAREIGCPVLALSSVSRASYRLAEADLEGRLAAFKEAGELEYTAYTALLLYGLPEDLQNRFNYAPGVMNTYKPMTLDLCKNREGCPGRLAVKWTPGRDTWEDAMLWPGSKR
jgi:replicative DNA helicase